MNATYILWYLSIGGENNRTTLKYGKEFFFFICVTGLNLTQFVVIIA